MPLRPPLPLYDSMIRVLLPGLTQWHSTVARTWCAVAFLAVAAGVAWRLGDTAPPLERVLDTAGLALLASAYWLAPALERLLAELHQHQSGWQPSLRHLPSVLLALAGAGLALAAAPLGLLLAYDATAIVISGGATDGAVWEIPAWCALAVVLLLLGPGLVVLAAGTLAVLRAVLKPGLAALAWIAVLVLWHAKLAGVPWFAGQPVTLGGMLQWMSELLERAAVDPSQSLYLTELLWALATPPLLLSLTAVLMFVLAALLVRRAQAGLPVWIVPGLAVTATATYAYSQSAYWVHDMSRRDPGDWSAALGLGLQVLLLGCWYAAWDGEAPAGWRRQAAELAWCWWALAACATCTVPYIWAGQADHAAVLRGLLGALASATPLLLLTSRIGAGLHGWPLLRTGALLVLLPWLTVPLTDTGATAPAALARTIAEAWQQPGPPLACYWLLVCLAGASFLLWPWPARCNARIAQPAGSHER